MEELNRCTYFTGSIFPQKVNSCILAGNVNSCILLRNVKVVSSKKMQIFVSYAIKSCSVVIILLNM